MSINDSTAMPAVGLTPEEQALIDLVDGLPEAWRAVNNGVHPSEREFDEATLQLRQIVQWAIVRSVSLRAARRIGSLD